ncbi:sodium-dependent glucose transporter 1-like [Centroberyx affinis]|uniref:sodium-dependent glucose transporter 1-like n=1 Tax=Centroberyx affinis TaxID=166261 RepID=UPI003A5BFFA9
MKKEDVQQMKGGNVLILNTWGDQAGPHMQALHFSFAAGAFVSPIIAKLLHSITATITSILFPVMYKLASAPGGQVRKPHARGRPDADDSEYCQALLDSGADDEEQEDNEDDADFEVIEMDDAASLMNSPNQASSPPDVTGLMGGSTTPSVPLSL